MLRFGLILAVLLSVSVCFAVPVKKASFKKRHKYRDLAVIVGGQTQKQLYLAKIDHYRIKKKRIHRFVLSIDDVVNDEPLKRSGYFHISANSKQKRITIELENVQHSQINEQQIEDIFKKTKWIKEVDVATDPFDSTTTIVLNTTRPLAVEVFERKGKKNRMASIVLDIKSRKSGKRKRK
jgi:hypothetical protein